MRLLYFRPKWANAFFVQKNQCFTYFFKLIREIPLFWNSICGQLSYNKLKIKKKKKILELVLHELKFHAIF